MSTEDTTTALVGRGLELARLRDFVTDGVPSGEALLVVGDPGVGKSTLLSEAAREARNQRMRVLTAVCSQFDLNVGYSGLYQMLTPYRSAMGQLSVRHRAVLEGCLGLVDGPPATRPDVVRAVLSLLRRLAREAPVLVAVDDLHWMDRSSATTLSLVVPQLRGSRVGLLGALRAGHESLFDRSALPVLELEALGGHEAAVLLARRAPELGHRERERILDMAAGNPLALMELPLANDATARPAREMSGPLPQRLQQMFAPRVEELGEGSRQGLLLAGLASTDDLRAVLAAGAGQVAVEDLKVAERRRLVTVDVEAQRIRFAHPLVRSIVVALASPGQRRAAHRALGVAELEHRERRARHLADATVGQDEAVARLLDDGAHLLLRRGDAAGAVSMLVRAADLSVDAAERTRRLGEAAYVGADVTGDLSRVAGLLDVARQRDPAALVSLETAAAAAYMLLHGDGDVDMAHRLLVSALTAAHRREPTREVVVEALHTLLGICYFGARSDLWEPFYVELGKLDDAIPMELHLNERLFAAPATDAGRSLGLLRTAIDALSGTEDPNRVIRVATAAFYADDLDRCRPALWRVVTHGLQGGAVTAAINAWMLLAWASFNDGEWRDATRWTAEGLRLAERNGYQRLAWSGHYCLALMSAARGDPHATRAADEMLRWAQPRGVGSVMAYAHHTLAAAASASSDHEAAYRHATAVTEAGAVEPTFAHAMWLTLDLVEAAVYTDRLPQARAHVRAVRRAHLDRLSSRFALTVAAAEALVADDDAGATKFEDALRTPGAKLWPFELARVELLYGERLHRLRRRTSARQHLQSAVDGFTVLGATVWVERARSALRAAGARQAEPLRDGVPHRSMSSGPARLTPREVEVAQLAASGLTNVQIAQRIGTSPRTVAAQLSRTLAKLGISSRAALRDNLGTEPRKAGSSGSRHGADRVR